MEYDYHYSKLLIRWKERGWRRKQMEVEFESPSAKVDFLEVISKLNPAVRLRSLG